jgi:hypothetical protein
MGAPRSHQRTVTKKTGDPDAAPPMFACAAFGEKSRMKIFDSTTGNPGSPTIALEGTLVTLLTGRAFVIWRQTLSSRPKRGEVERFVVSFVQHPSRPPLLPIPTSDLRW